LAANGKLEPAGDAYLAMIIAQGVSAKPGDRVVLSDVRIDHNHIMFDLNGGPEGNTASFATCRWVASGILPPW
jgi:hypothetical protein